MPTCGGADDRETFTDCGFDRLDTSTSCDGDLLCVMGFGSSGVVVLLLSVMASSYTRHSFSMRSTEQAKDNVPWLASSAERLAWPQAVRVFG